MPQFPHNYQPDQDLKPDPPRALPSVLPIDLPVEQENDAHEEYENIADYPVLEFVDPEEQEQEPEPASDVAADTVAERKLIKFKSVAPIGPVSRVKIKRENRSKPKSSSSKGLFKDCLLYTSPSPRDQRGSRMPSSA